MSIPLYWWTDKPNFGDLLSPIVVSYVSGRHVRYSDAPGKLLAIGSVLGFGAEENDCIWGSGLRSSYLKTKKIRVFAVRGPKTREILLGQGIECPEIYGDPACLMPWIYRPAVEKQYETAVLPHHSDSWLRQLALKNDVKLLTPCAVPKKVIDGILSARRLITSSLHGLIIAEAYGIPVVLRRDRSQKWEKHFKFLDYFFSTDRQDCTVWNLSLEESLKIIPDIPKPRPIDLSQLIEAFPKEYCNEVSQKRFLCKRNSSSNTISLFSNS